MDNKPSDDWLIPYTDIRWGDLNAEGQSIMRKAYRAWVRKRAMDNLLRELARMTEAYRKQVGRDDD